MKEEEIEGGRKGWREREMEVEKEGCHLLTSNMKYCKLLN